jgi:hypothetical protein
MSAPKKVVLAYSGGLVRRANAFMHAGRLLCGWPAFQAFRFFALPSRGGQFRAEGRGAVFDLLATQVGEVGVGLDVYRRSFRCA